MIRVKTIDWVNERKSDVTFLAGAESPKNGSIRLLLQTCDMLFFVLYTAYSTKLTSMAMLYNPPPPIQDITDLLSNTNWRFGLINSSLEYNTLRVSTPVFGKFLFMYYWKT